MSKIKLMPEQQIYTPRVVGGRYGVTCIFPTLQDIIDYEEKRRVPEQGYARFIPSIEYWNLKG
jgi:hypothetical protein